MRLRKEIKYIFIALFISMVFVSSFFLVVKAGSLTPSGPVGSTMHSLQEIYDVLAGDVIAFDGAGTDDMTTGGSFTGLTTLSYRVEIDAEGSPDTFAWSDDGGSTWDVSGVAVTGLAQTLNNGVTITFEDTDVHTLGDGWSFTRQAADINGNVIQQLKYISNNLSGSTTTLQEAYDNSISPATITDSSAAAILTIEQSGAGKIIDLKNGTISVFSVDNTGNVTMGASTLTGADSAQITSGGASDLALNAGSGKIKAATGSTFYNEGGYAIAAAGEEILRASIPIFGYDFPARYSNSSAAIKISRDIILDAGSFPAIQVTGVDRRYKFKIQYANNLAVGDSSWQVINDTDPLDVYAPFTVSNTAVASLDETSIYYTPAIATLPDIGDEWYLQVTAPAGTVIQIYQIELLAYDVLQ